MPIFPVRFDPPSDTRKQARRREREIVRARERSHILPISTLTVKQANIAFAYARGPRRLTELIKIVKDASSLTRTASDRRVRRAFPVVLPACYRGKKRAHELRGPEGKNPVISGLGGDFRLLASENSTCRALHRTSSRLIILDVVSTTRIHLLDASYLRYRGNKARQAKKERKP